MDSTSIRMPRNAIIASLLFLTACGEEKSSEPKRLPLSLGNTISNAPEIVNPAPTPPNYVEKEGDIYYYVSAVSDEDQKKGKAVGEVLPLRYVGESDGIFNLQLLSDNGQVISSYECPKECRIIKRMSGGKLQRMPYEPSSVIGSAFQDALAGKLIASKKSRQQMSSTTPDRHNEGKIPSAFIGEWNADLAACRTALNDSRLRIEKDRIRFHESDASVRNVVSQSERAVRVTASFVGEGQSWTDTISMTLSSSRNELTIEGLARYRCS